jgi:predicted Zn-dependent protease
MNSTTRYAMALAALFLLCGCASTPTVQEERDMAKEVERQARMEFDILHDRVVDQYVDDLGEELLVAAGPQAFDYTFTVIDDPALNAMAAPGGAIFVTTGMILNVRNVSELAGVMGHEIGHVVHRHSADNMVRAQNAGLMQTALVVAAGILGGGGAANAANILTGVSALAYINNYGREAESESDAYAVEILPNAGYDPNGIVSMFETIRNETGGRQSSFLSSHPAPQERMDATRALIETQRLSPGLRRDDGGRLEIIQHRIRLLTGATKEDRRERRN